MSTVATNDGWLILLPGLFLMGVGLGVIGPPLSSTAVGVVPPWQSGMAAGINTTFRQLGLVTGIAGLGAIFQHSVQTHVASALKGTSNAGLTDTLASATQAGGAITLHRRPAGDRAVGADARRAVGLRGGLRRDSARRRHRRRRRRRGRVHPRPPARPRRARGAAARRWRASRRTAGAAGPPAGPPVQERIRSEA